MRRGHGDRLTASALAYIILFLGIQFFSTLDVCIAEEYDTILTAERLELFPGEKKYIAAGSVTIKRKDAVITADEITYFEETSDVKAKGDVRYDDAETSIRAGSVDLNIDSKTGTLYDAEFFQKKNSYHLLGGVIEKRGDAAYYSPDAVFTTCDLPAPEWCFRGKNISAAAGDAIRAKDVSFLIKDLPVLRAPYLWASLNTERHTGFLMPGPSYTKARGAGISIPFFWAISENRDLTAIIDIYSKRGTGQGLEYRFVAPGGIKSDWWAYHIRDTLLGRDYLEIRGHHDDRLGENIKGFLNLNYVNEKDYYRQYTYYRDLRLLRYVESTGEVSLSMPNSRVYLLAQYWIDLKDSTGDIPQRLPEIGYVQRYTKFRDVMLSVSASASNMFREHGVSAVRADVSPRIMHSFGNDFTVTQIMGLRDTFYSYYKYNDGRASLNRAALEYDLTGHTRLYKDYSSFIHIIEPSIRYHFVHPSETDLHSFDSTELYGKTSAIELGLLNRGIFNGSEMMTVRATQAIETNNSDRPFLPIRLDARIRTPAAVSIEVSYDYYGKRIDTASSEVSLQIDKTNVSFGQRFSKKEEINVFTAGAAFSPSKGLNVSGNVWYDARGAGIRDMSIAVKYTRQCWSVKIEAVRKPGDYSFKVMFDLAGLTSKAGAAAKTGSPAW